MTLAFFTVVLLVLVVGVCFSTVVLLWGAELLFITVFCVSFSTIPAVNASPAKRSTTTPIKIIVVLEPEFEFNEFPHFSQ